MAEQDETLVVIDAGSDPEQLEDISCCLTSYMFF